MSKIMKIIIWFLAVFAFIFVAATVFIALYGKKIVETQIEKNVNMKTSLGGMSLNFPFTVNLNNLEIERLFKAEKISISPNIFSLFPGKLVLGKVTLVKPVVTLQQSADGSLNLPKLKQGKAAPPVLLTGLVIEEGRFIFTDYKVRKEGMKVILNNVRANISKVAFPVTNLSADFRITADIADSDYNPVGSLSASGNIDFLRKNLDANFALKDLNVVYFSPYLGDFISKKKIVSAKANLNSRLKSQNNNLDIDSKFRLSNLVYAEAPEEEGILPEINPARDALDFFIDENGNLDLEFQIQTKLDHPSLSVDELKSIILKAAARNLMNANPVTLIQKVQEKIEQYKDIGEQFKNIFGKEK